MMYACEGNGKHVPDTILTKCVLGCYHPGLTCANYQQYFDGSPKQLAKWKVTRTLADHIIGNCRADGCMHLCPDLDAFYAKCGFVALAAAAPSRAVVSLAPYRETLQRISGMVLTVDSDAKTIKAAYRIAGLKTHPDKTGSDGAEFLEVQQAFDYLTGRETAPKDEQDMLEERVSRDQSQFAIMPLHETSNQLQMMFYVGLLQILQNPEAELYGNSPWFNAPDGTKYWFNCSIKFCDARFGIRKKGVAHGDPLTLAEIKKIQPNFHTPGGNVTRFFEYDRDASGILLAASRDDETRLNSHGWKALCYCIGHSVDTQILNAYLQAYQNLPKRKRDARMEGQLEPAFKMRKIRDREGRMSTQKQCPEYERYMKQILDKPVFQLPYGDKSWDAIFNGFRTKYIEHSKKRPHSELTEDDE